MSSMARGVAAGIFDEPTERGFGVFVDSADGSHEAGIEKRFDARAELLGGLFGSACDVVDHGAAAGFAGGATFRIESGERGLDPLGRFRDGEIDLDLGLTAKLFESASRSAVQQGS